MSLRTFYNQFVDALGRRVYGAEAGKLWVESTLKRLAGESNILVENISWKGPSDDQRLFDRMSYAIYFYVGGKKESIELPIELPMDTLEDCVDDKEIQLRVESKIRERITPLKH